jgi:hypothetical protein
VLLSEISGADIFIIRSRVVKEGICRARVYLVMLSQGSLQRESWQTRGFAGGMQVVSTLIDTERNPAEA